MNSLSLPRVSPVVTDRGKGPVVVLLHGQPGAGSDWDAVTKRLTERRRVIVPDRPGYGRTGGQAMGVAANAEVVVELLDQLQIERAVVGAHSWAGGIALDLAERHPSRVEAIVLVGSVGGTGSVDHMDHLLAARVIGPAMSMVGLLAFRRPHRGDAISDLVQSWRSFMVEQRALIQELPQIAAFVERIGTPAVVVMGERDRVVRPSSQLALAVALANSELIRVPGVGHAVSRDAPELLASVIEMAAAGTKQGFPGAAPQ